MNVSGDDNDVIVIGYKLKGNGWKWKVPNVPPNTEWRSILAIVLMAMFAVAVVSVVAFYVVVYYLMPVWNQMIYGKWG